MNLEKKVMNERKIIIDLLEKKIEDSKKEFSSIDLEAKADFSSFFDGCTALLKSINDYPKVENGPVSIIVTAAWMALENLIVLMIQSPNNVLEIKKFSDDLLMKKNVSSNVNP